MSIFNYENIEECHRLLMEIYTHMQEREETLKLPQDLMEGTIGINSTGYFETLDKGKGTATGFFVMANHLADDEGKVGSHFFKTSKIMLEQIEKWHKEEMSK